MAPSVSKIAIIAAAAAITASSSTSTSMAGAVRLSAQPAAATSRSLVPGSSNGEVEPKPKQEESFFAGLFRKIVTCGGLVGADGAAAGAAADGKQDGADGPAPGDSAADVAQRAAAALHDAAKKAKAAALEKADAERLQADADKTPKQDASQQCMYVGCIVAAPFLLLAALLGSRKACGQSKQKKDGDDDMSGRYSVFRKAAEDADSDSDSDDDCSTADEESDCEGAETEGAGSDAEAAGADAESQPLQTV